MTRPPAPSAAASQTVVLRYDGDAPLILLGPVTGTRYYIGSQSQDVAANQLDVRALIATGRFTRVER